jgi:hypothetical protein
MKCGKMAGSGCFFWNLIFTCPANKELVYVPSLAQDWTAMRPTRKGTLVNLALKSALALLILASASLVEARQLQTLCLFNSTNGASPQGGLTLGNDGNFYGTTSTM